MLLIRIRTYTQVQWASWTRVKESYKYWLIKKFARELWCLQKLFVVSHNKVFLTKGSLYNVQSNILIVSDIFNLFVTLTKKFTQPFNVRLFFLWNHLNFEVNFLIRKKVTFKLFKIRNKLVFPVESKSRKKSFNTDRCSLIHSWISCFI